MNTSKVEKRLSLYFPFEMAKEISHVSQRMNRPRSWVLQMAWELTKEKIFLEKPRYSESWKNDFISVVDKISRRTARWSEDEIEAFAVKEARIRR